MESITIKVDDRLAGEIETAMNPYYSTKTEFIREAIRNKIKAIESEKLDAELRKYLGKSKIKTSYAEERRIREEVGREIAKRAGIKLD